jgi:hypothetical protein
MMKEIHIFVPEYLYKAWKEYASQFSTYREALYNLQEIKKRLEGKMFIEEPISSRKGKKKEKPSP